MAKQIRNGTVELDDGILDYAVFGDGPKTLIVLPGLSDALTTVRGKALLLAGPYRPYLNDYTVYMFSRRRNLPADYSIAQMAEDQVNAIHTLGLHRVSVLGVSQGGMIALSMAVDHPECIERLVLAVTSSRPNDLIRTRLNTWNTYAQENRHQQLMIDTAEHSYSPAYLTKYRRAYPLLGLVGKPKTYDRFFTNTQAILSFDVSARLSSISCPTLMIGGETDDIVGVEESYYLQEHIPSSELYVYPGLGHALFEEAPDFYARVFAFLGQAHP